MSSGTATAPAPQISDTQTQQLGTDISALSTDNAALQTAADNLATANAAVTTAQANAAAAQSAYDAAEAKVSTDIQQLISDATSFGIPTTAPTTSTGNGTSGP